MPEAIWAGTGAALLVALRLTPPDDALRGAGKGVDVYLFLTGMMLLAELARAEGLFDAAVVADLGRAVPQRVDRHRRSLDGPADAAGNLRRLADRHPDIGFSALDAGQKAAIATIAAGFVGLLSLFNIGGRSFWTSLSNKIGRKATYFTFFGLGIILYASAPTFAHMGSKAPFVAA